MAKFKTKAELRKAPQEEVMDFFKHSVFEGVFTKEVKSTHTDKFCGNIHSIHLQGYDINPLGQYVNVPARFSFVDEGPCIFRCRPQYIGDVLNVIMVVQLYAGRDIPSTSSPAKQKNFTTERNHNIDPLQQELYDAWGVEDSRIIGYYHRDEENDRNVIDDIRKPNFVHIPYYPNDPFKRSVKVTFPFDLKVDKDDYYLFTWKLFRKNDKNPYQIVIDFGNPPSEIEPKWFIDTLFNDRHNDKSKNFDSTTNFLDTLSKQLSAKDSTFVYELLQNANDYPVEGRMVDVEFHITDNYLLFMHSGATFNVRNISGICGINEKEKVANKKTIGYKGIGFKTVFLNNHYVYLRTGKYSFRFEEKAEKIKRLNAPWPILPVWTEHNEVANEVNEIFDASIDKFGVQIALRPDKNSILHQGKNSYENLFMDVFYDSNIILFIPNINSVKVFIEGEEVRECKRNNDAWVINDYCENIKEEFQRLVNKTIDTGNSRIPEKYKDFDTTKVSFACRRNGAELQKVEDATVYCYLPTSASWGFNFLMNTDMIPKGDRNDIESEVKLLDEHETNFNEELAAIAGSKFFDWIKDLINSKKYDFKSIFALVPNFEISEHKKYKTYIERFQIAFEERLKKEALIPAEDGKLHLLVDIIYDETLWMTKNIMTDEEFYNIVGYSADTVLPCKRLRHDKKFCNFLKHYLEVFDCKKNIWTKDDFVEICADDDFREWVTIIENNNRLLNFLLEEEWLDDFKSESVFIDQKGDLHSACEMYYDVDKYLNDISSFCDLFSYLSSDTRSYFANNEKWEEDAVDIFDTFDADDFVNDILLSKNNIDDTKQRLEDKNTSIHFYKFLAENVEFKYSFLELPFIDDYGNVVDDFNDKFLFCSSEEGKTVFANEWLNKIDFAFLSKDYTKITHEYFMANDSFGVIDYSDEVVVNDIILSDDYNEDINDAQQQNFESSKAFVDFCFKNSELFSEGDLRNYALHVYDKDGDYSFVLSEDNIYFSSVLYDTYSAKKWLHFDWMYCLDDSYYCNEREKKFIKNAFNVENLTEIRFYCDVVRPHLYKIFDDISGSNDSEGDKNVDFIAYLDQNYSHIFEKEKDEDKFAGLILLGHNDDGGVYDISIESKYVYLYDENLLSICNADWFPSDIVDICTERYGQSKAVLAIGAKKYEFKNFFSDVVTNEMKVINDNITSLEDSVAFHQLVIENKSELTEKQQSVMKDAKIFLYGSDDCVDKSSGHKILSDAAEELASMGVVDFSDLDIIDPTYSVKGNNDYWVTRLENRIFSVNDFVTWIAENESSFIVTLEDENLNIAFWQWAKAKLSRQTDKLSKLPILLKDGTTTTVDNIVYLSDSYILEGGIETIVTKYDKEANFISNKYIQSNDDIDSWQSFWTGVGVHSEILAILTNTIIPRLSEIEDETLPASLAKHLNKLEELYGEKTYDKLENLKVKGYDGNFHALSDSIYLDCEESEPFKYIALPNQIVFSPSSLVTERRLVKELVNKKEGIIIEGLKAWITQKINRYLDIQNSNDDDVLLAVHFQFINELSAMYKEDDTSLTDYVESLKEVLILDENEEFGNGANLTMSSVYKPFCDFQKFLPESYNYTSDRYDVECTNNVGRILHKFMNVHSDFIKSDIDSLEVRLFAVYFWSNYLPNKKVKSSILGIKDMIKDGLFNEIKCIPTRDYMCKPSSLYSTKISNFVKKTEDWENKLPIESIPNIEYTEGETLFDLMPFNKSLSFADCLYALFSFNGMDNRSTLVKWMLAQYDGSCDEKVTEYRADTDALWTNVKNDKVHIAELYALDDGKDSTLLNEYFGSSEKILNKYYLPSDFREACNMLQIDTITTDDLEVVPKNEIVKGEDVKHELYLFALAIAGIEANEDWNIKYGRFESKISELSLRKCDAISIEYIGNRAINLSLKKFHPDYEKKVFYYVGNWKSALVFKDFVQAFIKYLDIELSVDFVSNMMYEGKNYAIELIKERNELLLNESFKGKLDELIPGIKNELIGTESDDKDADEHERRHTYSSGNEEFEGNTGDEEISDTQAIERTVDDFDNIPKVHVSEHERSYPGYGGDNISQTSPSATDSHSSGNDYEKKGNNNTRETLPHTTHCGHPQSDDRATVPFSQDKPEDSERLDSSIATISNGQGDVLSTQQKIDAQIEAQKWLRTIYPLWLYPENFAEVDENGAPSCFSVFHITDEKGNYRAIVLKSYKYDKAPFSINPEEWDYITKEQAELHIYRGNGKFVKLHKEDLVRNQNSIILRFSTENLDVEDKISQFSDALHYFNQIHFDFESFNISNRAKSICGSTNKNEGTQTEGSDDDI